MDLHELHGDLEVGGMRAVVGRAGGAGSNETGGICCVDALRQLLFGETPASQDSGAAARAVETAEQCRRIGMRYADGFVPTGDAWALLSARRWGASGPRPHLVELVVHGGLLNWEHSGRHGTPEPWDGQVVLVLTHRDSCGCHTVPIRWVSEHAATTHGSVRAQASETQVLPGMVQLAPTFSYATYAAVRHDYEPLWECTAEGAFKPLRDLGGEGLRAAREAAGAVGRAADWGSGTESGAEAFKVDGVVTIFLLGSGPPAVWGVGDEVQEGVKVYGRTPGEGRAAFVGRGACTVAEPRKAEGDDAAESGRCGR